MRADGRPDDAADSTWMEPFREQWPDPVEDVRAQFRPLGRSVREHLRSAVPDGVPWWRSRPARRMETYWRWFAAVLFVVVALDMVTTTYAADAVGPGGEANPLIRLAIERGVLEFTALNLAAVALAAGFFRALVRVVRTDDSPHARYVEAAIAVWLGLLLAAGLFVFANNLAVVLYGRSLVG